MNTNEDLATEDKAFAVCIIVIYSLCLLLTVINAYLYLLKLSKYKFLPLLLLFTGIGVVCCLVIANFAEYINPGSNMNKNEATWLFYMINIRLFSLVFIVGFCGLIVDLLLMLRLMTQCS